MQNIRDEVESDGCQNLREEEARTNYKTNGDEAISQCIKKREGLALGETIIRAYEESIED